MASYNLEIIKGSTYTVRLVAKNDDGTRFNLTGYSTRGYIKKKFSDSSPLLNLEPSVHPSYISGFIDIDLNATGTANLLVGKFPYDIEIVRGDGVVTRIINGYALVQPEVTV